LEGVVDAERGFVLHPGAELYIDKRRTSTIGPMQMFKAMDFRTNRVRLEPGDSHTDFFDLGAFLPDAQQSDRFRVDSLPSDFSPILQFHDSHGNSFYADPDGLHAGLYAYLYEEELLKIGTPSASLGILTTRRALRWLGWKQIQARGLGEPIGIDRPSP
jgi:hypothetical protein